MSLSVSETLDVLSSRLDEVRNQLKTTKKDHRVISFFNSNCFIGYCNFYLYNNITKAKNCFYEAAMAKTYYFEKLGYNLFETLNVPSPYLLSDSNYIIKKFCTLTDTEGAQKSGHIFYQIGKAIQYSLLRNDEALFTTIEMLKLRTKSGVGKNFLATINLFEGILQKKEDKIFSAVNEIQKKMHRHQVILKDYFAIEATRLAKLAWMKSFEIDFKNKYIPQELLPIKPLEHYETYDFYNWL